MFQQQHITVVTPVLNEELAIGVVIQELFELRNGDDQQLIDDIIVCDNGSNDNSANVALRYGARVVHQPTMGYGIACLTALEQISQTDIVVFVDGDHSCVATQVHDLLKPLADRSLDLVIGSRTLGRAQSGALTPPQRFGNALAVRLIQWFWGFKMTDLGPFRAIRFSALRSLNMQDVAFGWTVEMQIKAIQLGLAVGEVPVDSLRRIGTSKISGTVKGVVFAGLGIIGTILKLRFQQNLLQAQHDD